MVNYSNGKIYKLINKIDDKIYIGSTCAKLNVRFVAHKSKSKIKPTPAHKHFIHIGFENVSIELIENYECKTKKELELRERHWINELKPKLNYSIPTRTKKEYKLDNKDRLKEHYLENRDEIID